MRKQSNINKSYQMHNIHMYQQNCECYQQLERNEIMMLMIMFLFFVSFPKYLLPQVSLVGFKGRFSVFIHDDEIQLQYPARGLETHVTYFATNVTV